MKEKLKKTVWAVRAFGSGGDLVVLSIHRTKKGALAEIREFKKYMKIEDEPEQYDLNS